MDKPSIKLEHATLSFGSRVLWEDMNLSIHSGEFIAILGPNGSGKSSFLKVLLGLNELSEGSAFVYDQESKKGNPYIGYIPQQRNFDENIPIRGRDLIQLGLDGHKWGFGNTNVKDKNKIDSIIEKVEAQSYANKPIGKLSGGEQQRLRIAQALVSDPKILLCDEPLLSLDLKNQESICNLINNYRKEHNATVLFVEHDINPILTMVDRVLYFAKGKWSIGTPQEVLTTENLTEIYGSKVNVFHAEGRIFIVGGGDTMLDNQGHHYHG